MIEKERKHILVLAYQISPYRGSEYAVAWNYVTRMSKYHRITVLYGAAGEHMGDDEEIAEYLKNNSCPNVEFVFVKPSMLANLFNLCNRAGFFVYSSYLAYNVWHRLAYLHAQKIIEEQDVDIVHYLGPIGYREPGYLWRLNKPYIWGPVGGISNYPRKLVPSMSIKTILKHQFRATINNYQFENSLRLKKALNRCNVFFTATTETQDRFKNTLGKDSIFLAEHCIASDIQLNENKFNDIKKIELVFVGNIDGRKNLRLLLEALKLVDHKKIHLNIVGDGPEKTMLEKFSHKNRLSKLITWHGKKSHEEALKIFDKSHLHIITSLNEANTTVLFEAMAYGVPTLSLDHCGMHDTICDQCGFKIPIINYKQVVSDIANMIDFCVANPDVLKEKARGTVKCAEKNLWEKREEIFLKAYDQAIENYSK